MVVLMGWKVSTASWNSTVTCKKESVSMISLFIGVAVDGAGCKGSEDSFIVEAFAATLVSRNVFGDDISFNAISFLGLINCRSVKIPGSE